MIIHVAKNISESLLKDFITHHQAVHYEKPETYVLITPSATKETDRSIDKYITKQVITDTDIQLAGTKYLAEKRIVKVGNITFGAPDSCVMMAGPCSVESEKQMEQTAELLLELGTKVLRAGAYKPRTSPYSFQGLGLEGLKLLDKMRQKYGFYIITEVRDSTHADDVIAYADIVQIGAKSMYDHGILRKCGKSSKPVLLKRGFGTTLQELVQMAEFILSGGNENVMLCERGIRTFETKTRFTLDLCGAAYLKYNTNLPVILDPSHAMGYAYGVPDLAKACLAMNVSGLLIEVHPDPKVALSDASQQLSHEQFRKLYGELKSMSEALHIALV
jgi:3-deoxy-7-phosphoheptulonate synthase